LPSGRKLSVKGGKEGLFVPTDLDVDARLLVTEGPSDCAALLDLGFSAVGRPSCMGGVKLLMELVKLRQPADMVVIADGDAPGQRGAESLAAVLVACTPAVRVIAPPAGVKDVRQWKQRGATAADVAAAIDAAAVRRLQITSRRRAGAHHGR
jgi:DNA primase